MPSTPVLSCQVLYLHIPKITIWVYFGGREKCWYILMLFWYIVPLLVCTKEKFGSPGIDLTEL
jgi:hypothetical protein